MEPLLIIANPYSGKKQGKKICNSALNIFQNIDYHIIETTHQNHPYEIANSINLNKFSGVCVIGGDGTMHEVINGMINRTDNNRLPIGLIPGGTGNSFMHDMNCLNPIDAAKKISHLKIRKIDLMKIITNDKKIYSYNVAGWGMPPDINILAEKMRWMGPQRYNIASLIEIIKLKERYNDLILDGKNISDDYSFILCCNTIHTGKGMKIAPKAQLDDGLIDVVTVKKTNSLTLFKLFPKIFSGKHINNPNVNYHQVKSISITPKINTKLIVDGEIIGRTPCSIKILPKNLDVFN